MFRLTRVVPSVLLLHVPRTVDSLFVSQTSAISRTAFVGQFTAAAAFSSSAVALKASCSLPDMDDSISLLNSVYGPVDGPNFPLPMPSDEAGLCADGRQRRYLWTDAFGVLAFVSLADQYESEGNTAQAEKYRRAADTLVDVVHRCLGSPRSDDLADAMTVDAASPTGHVGLRIGKTLSRKVTDYGMSFDGMYWHYLDKWLLALARSGHVDEGIRIAKSCFYHFMDPGDDGTGRGGGMRWKLSVDASAPPSLERARASDDTLVALIVFSILETAGRTLEMTNTPSLAKEIGMLRQALRGYRPRVTEDPLGWGLEAMYDQFIQGHPRQRALASLHSSALDPSHLSLPFRLYGAMIGARIAGEAVAPPSKVDKLIKLSLAHEARAAARGLEEHSSINRVMLAMCLLCPGALGKLPTDPIIQLE